jgi:hypothetical protein
MILNDSIQSSDKNQLNNVNDLKAGLSLNKVNNEEIYDSYGVKNIEPESISSCRTKTILFL